MGSKTKTTATTDKAADTPPTDKAAAGTPAGEPKETASSGGGPQDQGKGEEGATATGEAAGAPETVRCLFRVKEKKRRSAAGGNIYTDLEMEPVQPKRDEAQRRQPSENDHVWEQAPAGAVILFTLKDDVGVFFEVGEEYLLDFRRASEMPTAE